MTPTVIIEKAAAEGVRLAVTPAGTIRAIGHREAVDRWLPRIREQKPAIIAALGGERQNCRDDLETGIRRMAAFWEYFPEELTWALARARENPEGWRKIVEFDAAWRVAR